MYPCVYGTLWSYLGGYVWMMMMMVLLFSGELSAGADIRDTIALHTTTATHGSELGGFFAKSRTHSLFCNNSADTAPSKYVVRRRRVVGGGDSRNPTKITIYLTIHPKANIFTYATGTIHQHTPTMAVAKDTDFQWGKGMIHGTKFPPPSRKTTIIA